MIAAVATAVLCEISLQQIQAAGSAFAAILSDGSVVTWGRDYSGGDSSAVRDQLKNVQQIQTQLGEPLRRSCEMAPS